MFFALLSNRIVLRKRLIADVSKTPKLSKKEGSWYYAKCSKTILDCRKALKDIKQDKLDTHTIPMRRNLYTAYFTQAEAQQAIKSGIKLDKIRKTHKELFPFDHNQTKQYAVISTPECELPYHAKRFSPNSKIFETDDDPMKVYEAIRHIGCVRAFEQVPHHRLLTRFTKSVLHHEKPEFLNTSAYTLRNEFLAHGIGGHGQTVSIADTGLDPKLCWFADPDQDVIYENGEAAMDHRKISNYFRYADEYDSQGGHGTIISGIIAGQAICPDDDASFCPGSYYDGIAPFSRIIVNDLFKTGSDLIHWPGNGSDLFVFPRFMSAAAQLHAFELHRQSIFTYMIDQFQYLLPQMLFVFAAGDRTQFNQVVGTPCDSKNVLCIGSTGNHPISLSQADPSTPIYVLADKLQVLGFCDPVSGTTFMEALGRSEFQNNEREYFKISSGSDDLGIVLDKDGSLDIEKHKNCAAILVFHKKPIKGHIKRPVIRIPEQYYEQIKESEEINFIPYLETDLRHINFSETKKSPISNHGPTKLLRIKPEVLYPAGPVFAPRSGAEDNKKDGDETCGVDGLIKAEGSSISAAFGTGDIMLIRQYLKHGFYPTGAKPRERMGAPDPIKTSSYGLKAILANIARPVVEGTDELQYLDNSYGTPQLDKFILFPDTYEKLKKTSGLYGYRLFIEKIKAMNHFTYKFVPEDDGELRVSIGWNDPPCDYFSPTDILFKIDIRVETPEGAVIMGNREPDQSSFDFHNAVKLIRCKVKKGDKYLIQVIVDDLCGYDMADTWLMISGPFDHFGNAGPKKDTASEPKCGVCDHDAPCKNGFCVCPKGYYGDMCSSEIKNLVDKVAYENDNVGSFEWYLVSYTLKNWVQGSNLTIDFEKGKDSKFYYILQINEVPSWNKAACTSQDCEWVILDGDKIILTYESWDFLKKGDVIYFGIYSYDTKRNGFKVSFTKGQRKISEDDIPQDEVA